MRTKYLMILGALCLVLSAHPCSASEKFEWNGWSVDLNKGISVYKNGVPVILGAVSEYQLDSKTVSTSDYAKRKAKVTEAPGIDGIAKSMVVTYSAKEYPDFIQTLDFYDEYFTIKTSLVSDSDISINYMAPIVSGTVSDEFSADNCRRLFIPFDNDCWIRFSSYAVSNDRNRSYEVTSIYNPESRKGVVIGAIDHDNWKNAIDVEGIRNSVKAFSGVADSLTRDHKEHGYLTGKNISSARFVVGLFNDWRAGMEAFADANAAVTPKRPWDKAVPFGWNSWGALAFKVNHENSTKIADFFKEELQSKSFCNEEGILYIGLDSGWNRFSEEQLQDYADRCRANNQVPCIYWTPFTDWGKRGERTVREVPEYKYKDLYLYANGKPQELDGAFAIDPTHPAVQKMMEMTAERFRKHGFKYVKMDFMTHGRFEADSYYRKDITTGTQAYNYGMHLIDSLFHDMYINLSISPIFPAQYAESRRISCDAWNKITDTEYVMNALSFGWWIDRVYHYNDADHVVLREVSEGENRARITSAVITGMFITGDDFYGDNMAIERAKKYLTNPDINRLATGRSFRPLEGDNGKSDNQFVRRVSEDEAILVVFNYSDTPLEYQIDADRVGLAVGAKYYAEELWSHKKGIKPGDIVVIGPKDVNVFKINKAAAN